MENKLRSPRYLIFTLVASAFGLALLARAGIVGLNFWNQSTLTQQSQTIAQQDAQLSGFSQMTGYVKYAAVSTIEDKYTTVSWATRIKKVIDMLDELQSFSHGQSGDLVLSDFNVSLDTISFKGKVSDLSLLYGGASGSSLIDQFKKLDFIGDMHIKNYTKNGNYFSFVLEANVNNDGK
jgi:hypothetical protein